MDETESATIASAELWVAGDSVLEAAAASAGAESLGIESVTAVIGESKTGVVEEVSVVIKGVSVVVL